MLWGIVSKYYYSSIIEGFVWKWYTGASVLSLNKTQLKIWRIVTKSNHKCISISTCNLTTKHPKEHDCFHGFHESHFYGHLLPWISWVTHFHSFHGSLASMDFMDHLLILISWVTCFHGSPTCIPFMGHLLPWVTCFNGFHGSLVFIDHWFLCFHGFYMGQHNNILHV